MQTENYNLLDEKWIPVLHSDGTFDHVGIKEALMQAGRIRQITTASPLDAFAIQRFLLTLLYWKAGRDGGVQHVREALLRGTVPKYVFDAIQGEPYWFGLFDSKRPFLQDPSVRDSKNKKSAASLFAELASGTNIAHFHHGDDREMRLCARCATIGMLHVVPWSQAGGAGLTPSIHGAPPIMALAMGENLAVTLGLNLVPIRGRAGKARWTGHFRPTRKDGPVPYLEALTWNPRRIHLGERQRTGICWRCGKGDGALIGPIVYLKNTETQKGRDKDAFEWRDPAAFYPVDDGYRTRKSSNEARAASGTDVSVLLLEQAPRSMVVEANPKHRVWRIVVPCTNPANNKTFDHRQLDLAGFSREEIRATQATDLWSRIPKAVDGWAEPREPLRQGHLQFVQSAAQRLTYHEWLALSAAAYREMHESPAAFNVFTSVLWPLRGKVSGLPAKNVGWLVLKLMAAVPGLARVIHMGAQFCPLLSLPKRQLSEQCNGKAVRSRYPIAFPRGVKLEAALRAELERNMRKREPEQIDWAGLCAQLDELLE